jgi:hypothetical protein
MHAASPVLTPRALASRCLLIGLIGCSNEDPKPTCDRIGGPPVETARFDHIDYQVIGGVGGVGDGTSLHIEANGAVTRQTEKRGPEYGQIDKATVEDLVNKVRDAQFPLLCRIYPCADRCTDEFFDEVSVHVDGITRTARAGWSGHPPIVLQDLIDALQDPVDRPLS